MGSYREKRKGSGSYTLTAYCGYDSQGKKLRPKTKTIKPTGMSGKRLEKYLQAEAEKWQREVDTGMYLDGDKLTFAEFAQKWLTDYAEKQLQPKTIARYKDCLRRINHAIGHIQLVKLQPHHLNALYTNLAEKGVRRDGSYRLCPQLYGLIVADQQAVATKARVGVRTLRNLLKGNTTTMETACKIATALDSTLAKAFQMESGKAGLHADTIVKHHRLIHAILAKAYKWQLVTTNVANRAEPPKGAQFESVCYDEEQVKQLLESISSAETKHQVAVYLGLFGGLRVGEVCGLEWRDIDFTENSVTISRSRQHIPNMPAYDKEPKTERSKRTITLPEIAMSLLRRHRAEQAEMRLRLGCQWQHHDKVLTQWNGVPMNPQTPSHWLRKWLRANGLPHITFHQLRHTHITLLIANDVDIPTVSKRAGHAKIATTLNVYTHAIKSRDTAAANMLDDLMTATSALNSSPRRRPIDDRATQNRIRA
ncbi:MAG: site-specific integrase [Defluviitaleaceae bacterium]|nr:site-specific integrase [Defluviitaleaceae bacterium]